VTLVETQSVAMF